MKLLFTLFLGLPLFNFAQQSVTINSKKMFSLSQKEVKTFTLSLEKGKSYQITVEQKGIDVDLRLKNTDGKEIAYMDSPNGKFGPEIIQLTSQDYTDFILSVQPLTDENNSQKGKCTILVTEAVSEEGLITTILSPKQMKEDLLIFRSIREKANSGLDRYRTQTQLDSIYNWASVRTQSALSIIEFYKVLLVLTDFEGSNHNNTNLPYHPSRYIEKDKGYFPFFFRNIDNKLIVNYDSAELPLGSQVLSINGVSDVDLRKRFSKYCTTDGYNQTAKDKAGIENSFGWVYPFEFGTSDRFEIVYKPPGSEKTERINLPSLSIGENRARYFDRHSAKVDSLTDFSVQEKYSFERINAQTALLNFRIFTMSMNAEDPDFTTFSNYLDSLFVRMKKEGVENLLIDVRNNPGGNDPNYEKVFTYLTDHSFKENTGAYILFKQLPYPQYFKWNSTDKQNQKRELKELNEYIQSVFSVKDGNHYRQHPSHNPVYAPDSNRFRGNIYLLINENVGSAASHFASLVRGHSDATIVGMETTGGYYGHNGHFPVEYELPNSKIISRFSIVHVTQDAPQKASQPVGRGIIPDYTVAQSYEDFIKNEDTQLKFVLKLIENKKGN